MRGQMRGQMTGRAVVVAALAAASACAPRGRDIRIGSKGFTESVILGEIATLVARGAGAPARHEREIGGTRVLFAALARGDLDVYPEYTGTLAREISRAGSRATTTSCGPPWRARG